jgi:hypothetical protein
MGQPTAKEANPEDQGFFMGNSSKKGLYYVLAKHPAEQVCALRGAGSLPFLRMHALKFLFSFGGLILGA